MRSIGITYQTSCVLRLNLSAFTWAFHLLAVSCSDDCDLNSTALPGKLPDDTAGTISWPTYFCKGSRFALVLPALHCRLLMFTQMSCEFIYSIISYSIITALLPHYVTCNKVVASAGCYPLAWRTVFASWSMTAGSGISQTSDCHAINPVLLHCRHVSQACVSLLHPVLESTSIGQQVLMTVLILRKSQLPMLAGPH